VLTAGIACLGLARALCITTFAIVDAVVNPYRNATPAKPKSRARLLRQEHDSGLLLHRVGTLPDTTCARTWTLPMHVHAQSATRSYALGGVVCVTLSGGGVVSLQIIPAAGAAPGGQVSRAPPSARFWRNIPLRKTERRD
jgi:hypothetical protein